MILFFFN